MLDFDTISISRCLEEQRKVVAAPGISADEGVLSTSASCSASTTDAEPEHCSGMPLHRFIRFHLQEAAESADVHYRCIDKFVEQRNASPSDFFLPTVTSNLGCLCTLQNEKDHSMSVFDSLLKGYQAASERASPSVAELQGLRGRMVAEADDTAKVRSGEEQAVLRRNLLEVDAMIARATKTFDRAAAPAA